ncbi:PD-(D/E)XK motif protein [Paenibacillus sp. S150]|uniref:PD-(D/E)XK motif protein n=1 Tax=Paenibacillus sp. S150 TaxID=2749826 RepID=UPI001C580534|nr:PD-(D/E)XK motif protein [Paenibacillus sp. S150]MBW4081271.1 PD-(D/E)XK motif protein [Paenibacillus sp. S150]
MNKNIILVHEIFAGLDQEYLSKKWFGNDPLLSRQMRLSQDILAVFAVKKSDGKHILYLQCNSEDAVKGSKYPAWKGIAIDFSGFENAGMEGSYVRIEQNEESADEVYFAVADDLCACLQGIKRNHLRKELSIALERWSRFFSLRDNIKLSQEEQLGLFGELWMVRSMIQNDVGIQAIDYWKGPYRNVFDFSLQKMGIEIKTTASKRPYKVFINNEVQLSDRLAGGTLILGFIAVQPNDATGEALRDVAKEIEEYVKHNGTVHSLFQDKIFGCGLGKPYIDSYMTRYIVKEHAFFKVEEGFPRILSENLQNGLGDVSYSLEIGACSDYKMGDHQFWQIVQQFVKEEIA